MKLAMIGGGNMACALLDGLFTQKQSLDRITLSEPSDDRRAFLAERYPNVLLFADNAQAADTADVVILAVKPQLVKTVCDQLTDATPSKHALYISIAAGISIAALAKWINDSAPIVRCMPNTPAAIGKGITGMFANAHVTSEQKNKAQNLLSSVGQTLWVDDETLIDAVTAVSGSGPAYFFYFIECLRNSAQQHGLTEEQSNQLALHTAHGAAALALQSESDVHTLREQVTSKGGTTERGLEAFKKARLAQIVDQAVEAALIRAQELSSTLDQD